jgi:predicted alpha/beta hydrolase
MSARPTPLRIATRDGWSLHLASYPQRAAVAAPAVEAPPATGGAPPAAMLLGAGMMLDGRAMDRPAGHGLASFFQARGFAVYSLDLRGHGESGPPASRRVDWGFDELVTTDIPAAIEAVKERHPGLPLVWLGHSLSAHAGAVAVGLRPELPVDVLVLLCPGPWLRAFEPSWPLWQAKRGVLRLWDAATAVCGRFPAARLGLGTDDESRTYVRQNRQWATSGRWQSRDGAVDYLAALARVRCPTLVVSAGADLLCRPRSVRRFAAALGPPEVATAELWEVRGADLGRRRPPHHMEVITARPALPLWQRIDGWLRRRLAALASAAAR